MFWVCVKCKQNRWINNNAKKVSLLTDCIFKSMFKECSEFRELLNEIYLGKYKEMDYNNFSQKEKNLVMLNCTSIKKMEELAQGSKIRGKIMEKFKK